MRRWLRYIRPTAIDIRESEYIDHDDDLISIFPEKRSPTYGFVQYVAFGGRWNPWGIPWLKDWLLRGVPKDIISLKNEETIWTNGQRMEKVDSALISIVGLAMLIGPIWGLAYIQRMEYRLAVISGVIVVFFVVLVTTMSRLYEALVATAAYSAVLVVFLQAGVGRSA